MSKLYLDAAEKFLVIITPPHLIKLQRRYRFSRPSYRYKVRDQPSWSEDQDPLVPMVLGGTGILNFLVLLGTCSLSNHLAGAVTSLRYILCLCR